MTPRILVFAGSTRAGSFNRLLAADAARYAREVTGRDGGEVTHAELRDYPMPLYDGDREAAGVPAPVRAWKALLASHDAFVIAAPEYNSGYTPLLKNAIDWASRAHDPGEAPLAAFRGKPAAILSASPGALGGLRGLYQLRDVLQNIGVTVLADPHLVAIGGAASAFDDQGRLTDPRRASGVQAAVEALVAAARCAASGRDGGRS